jgi:uncharacterized protein (UPF0333 family)
MSDLGNEIYSGASNVGQIKTSIGLVLGIIFLIICLIVGIYLIFFDKNKHTQNVIATITDLSCFNNNCTLNVSYTFNNKSYNEIITTTGTNYVKNQSITLYIDPSNPSDISEKSLATDKTTGGIFIFVGIFIMRNTMTLEMRRTRQQRAVKSPRDFKMIQVSKF